MAVKIRLEEWDRRRLLSIASSWRIPDPPETERFIEEIGNL